MLILITVLCIFILSVGLFGSTLADIFNNGNVKLGFNNKRTAFEEDKNAELSNTVLKYQDLEIKSPIEEHIRSLSSKSEFIETLGGKGNISEITKLISLHLDQVKGLAEKIPDNPNYSDFIQSITDYKNSIDTYTSYDDQLVTSEDDPLTKLINDLDIAVDIQRNGASATNLESATAKLLESLQDGQFKNLLKTYTDDIMNLGSSIDYHIDSRLGEINLLEGEAATYNGNNYTDAATIFKLRQLNKKFQTIVENLKKSNGGTFDNLCTDGDNICLRDKILPYFDNIDFVFDNLAEECNYSGQLDPYKMDQISCNPDIFYNTYDQDGKYLEGDGLTAGFFGGFTLTDGTLIRVERYHEGCTAGKYSIYKTGICARIKFEFNGVQEPNHLGVDHFKTVITENGGFEVFGTETDVEKDCTINDNYCGAFFLNNDMELSELLKQLKAIQQSNLSNEKKLAIAKAVNVYRNGSYNDIASSSYNSESLCSSIGATAEKDICNFELDFKVNLLRY